MNHDIHDDYYLEKQKHRGEMLSWLDGIFGRIAACALAAACLLSITFFAAATILG